MGIREKKKMSESKMNKTNSILFTNAQENVPNNKLNKEVISKSETQINKYNIARDICEFPELYLNYYLDYLMNLVDKEYLLRLNNELNNEVTKEKLNKGWIQIYAKIQNLKKQFIINKFLEDDTTITVFNEEKINYKNYLGEVHRSKL